MEFTHYGRYDVRLQREGFEPVSGFGDADAPVWDFVGAEKIGLSESSQNRKKWLGGSDFIFKALEGVGQGMADRPAKTSQPERV